MKRQLILGALVWVGALYATVAAAQTDAAFLSALKQHYDGKTHLGLSFDQDMAAAVKLRDAFVAHLETTLGAPVGYKAALTNPGAQKKFGVDAPVVGILLEKMIHPSGATLPVHFGTTPLLEGDLMVRVGDAAINDADTPEALLAGLDAVVPFIELPDLIFKRGTVLNGPTLAATNSGARLGVIGTVIPLAHDAGTHDALRRIRLEINDASGELVGYGYAKALLGDPLEVVRLLRDTLKAEGKLLKPGDLLSLGSVTSMIQIKKAETYKVTYFGIPGADRAEVTVTFAD